MNGEAVAFVHSCCFWSFYPRTPISCPGTLTIKGKNRGTYADTALQSVALEELRVADDGGVGVGGAGGAEGGEQGEGEEVEEVHFELDWFGYWG